MIGLKEESGRFFFHFREIFEKCIEYNRKFKIPDSFQGDFEFFFKKKVVYFRRIFPNFKALSWSLLDDEGGITCMHNIIDTCHRKTLSTN